MKRSEKKLKLNVSDSLKSLDNLIFETAIFESLKFRDFSLRQRNTTIDTYKIFISALAGIYKLKFMSYLMQAEKEKKVRQIQPLQKL